MKKKGETKGKLPAYFRPVNNRKYKSRVSKCLKQYFKFFKQLEGLIAEEKEINIRHLYLESLRPFLIHFFTKTIKLGNFRKGDLKLEKLSGYKNYKEYGVVRYKEGSLLVSRNELILLYNAMQVMKQNLFDWRYINKIEITKPEAVEKNIILQVEGLPDTDGHFLFKGEERSVSSLLLPDSDKFEYEDDIGTDLIMSLSGTDVSDKDFSRSAICAIRGDEFFETETGLKIQNQQSLSFLVKCTTDFSWKFMNINPSAPKRVCLQTEQPDHEPLEPIFSVPCLFNGGFATFTELIQSLFVQYFVSFDDFKDVILCDVCSSLMLREREGVKKVVDPYSRPISSDEIEEVYRHYCSTKCSNSDPITRTKERNEVYNCRNRQKQVFENRLNTSIPFDADDCRERCKYGTGNLPAGGHCIHIKDKMDRMFK